MTLALRSINSRLFKASCFFLFVLTLTSTAQPTLLPLRPSFGLFFALDINQHIADFQQLPGIANCCPHFESGSGVGVSFGALYEQPFTSTLSGMLRAGMFSGSGKLASTEKTVVIIAGQDVDGEFEHTIDAKLSYLGLEPLIGFRLLKRFKAYAGMRLALTMNHAFNQAETIIKPNELGTFNNGQRMRNVHAGDLPDITGTQFAAVGGLTLEAPLNRDASIIAVPELFYTLAISSVTDNLAWRIGSLQLGVSLRYSPSTSQDSSLVLPPPEPPAPTPIQPTPTQSGLSAAVTALGIDTNGVAGPNVKLRIEEFVSVNMRPLLNYIFFDDNSATIPSRYVRLSSSQSDGFNVETLHDVETLPTYYQILNIVGRRMRMHPLATMTLVGCNADEGSEKGNGDVSRRRAEAVRDYLKNVWGIAENRLRIEGRDLPLKPTNPQEPEGPVENRRVELYADRPEILEPVVTNDTLRKATPPTVRFQPTATAGAGLAHWTMTASQGGQLLKQFTGDTSLPATLDWSVAGDQMLTPRGTEPIIYELRVLDASGGEYKTPSGSLSIEQITLRKKRIERIADREIDRYRLILFDFDQSNLNQANQRTAEFIKRRLASNATVLITGYTDRVGEAEHNEVLSKARAETTARALNVPSSVAHGEGETKPPFDNELPEGRFYSRTVGIVVETPVR